MRNRRKEEHVGFLLLQFGYRYGGRGGRGGGWRGVGFESGKKRGEESEVSFGVFE